ncbi:MAG: hypothetical protein U0Q22_13715 [Acidimicrobiales bacterium]
MSSSSARGRGVLAVVVTLVAVVALSAATGCSHRSDDLFTGKVDISRSTTTTDLPCAIPEAAERIVTESSLTATRADAAAKAATTKQLDQLTSTLPPSLRDEVEVLRKAFTTAWAGGTPDTDPFDTTEYLVADQVIRRYIGSGCTTPSS